MSTLDDYASASDGDAGDDVEDEDDECQCDELPDDVPCWPCYQDGTEFGGGDA